MVKSGEIEWRVESAPQDYLATVASMEARAAAIRDGTADELIWLLEHPPLYTAGTSAEPEELVDSSRFPVFQTGRGGRFTYHGPGQLVVYCMLDLAARGRDLKRYISSVEQWVIDTLSDFGVAGAVHDGRVGVWVDTPQGEAKIAAIGVRVRRWVSFHGFAINIAPDLSHYAGIVPCGLPDYPVTSLAALEREASRARIEQSLKARFPAFLAGLSGAQES